MASVDNNNTVLADNGIFQLKKNDDLQCMICTKDANASDWQKHIENLRHVGTLERFNSTFERRDARVSCKVCHKELEWKMVKVHAYFHTIVPWFEPVDTYKKFFENQMQEWETQFYCYPCDIIFPEWSTAFAHINTEERHKILITAVTPVVNFASCTTVETYKLLVSEGFILWSDTTVKCRICDRSDICLQDIYSHIRRPEHLDLKSKFVSILKERNCNETVKKQPSENSSDKETTFEPVETSSSLLIYKNMLNDSTLDNESLQNYSTFDNESSPNYLKSAKEGLPNYSSWLTNLMQAYQILPSMSNRDEKNSLSISPLGCESFPNNLNPAEKILASNSPPIRESLPNHSKTAEKNSPSISPPIRESLPNHLNPAAKDSPSNSSLVCESLPNNSKAAETNSRSNSSLICDSLPNNSKSAEKNSPSISPLVCESLPNQVKPLVLDTSLNPKGQKKKKKNSKPAEKNSPINSSLICENKPCIYIVQQNATDYYCKLCDLKLIGEISVNYHVVRTWHTTALQEYGCDKISLKEDNIYYCECCGCTVPDLKNLHRHVKKNSHMIALLCNNKKLTINPHTIPMKPETPKKMVIGTGLVSQIVPMDYIIQLKSTEFFCKICDRAKKGQTTVNDPFVEKLHAIAQDEYVCKNISMKIFRHHATREKIEYHCRCCDCHIFNHEDLCRHVHGQQHSLNASNNREILTKFRTSKDEKIFDSSKVEKDINEEMTNYLKADKAEQNHNKSSQLTPKSHDALLLPDMKGFSKNDDKTLRMDDTSNNINMKNFNSKSAVTESKSLNLGNEDINAEDNDRASLVLSVSSQVTSKRNDKSGRKPRVPKKTNVQKVAEVFDYDNDYIHDLKDKLKEINLGITLCYAVNTTKTYCLVCRKEIEVKLKNYIEHLRSLDHCENLEGMKKDHALFEIVPGQFSDFDLALHYMEESSEDVIHCFICNEEIENIDSVVQNHMEDKMHEQKRKAMQMEAQYKFEDIKSRAQCDWYNIHKYRCGPCSANFQSEFSFAKHLKCTNHENVVKKFKDAQIRLIYDFCESCSTLWYGSRTTHAYHCDIPTHKLKMSDGHCLSHDLPKMAKLLLIAPEEFIEATITYFNHICMEERTREEILICDVKKAAKVYPYTFGSRASGLSSPDSNIDLFLDSGNMYEGNDSLKDRTMAFATSVYQRLNKDSQTWEMVQLDTNFQANVPIIKAQHRATGLSCTMSFENGLSVENTKLIKLINDIFPGSQKMILVLKQWLAFCDLSGSERISNYALYWYVIFFLQQASILPSIATVIAMEETSYIIAGWEVAVSQDFSCNEAECNYNVKNLLIRFFTFYAKFDFRYDVACPLLGEVVKKRAFMDPRNLPKEMRRYITYMTNSDDSKPFTIDSVMCIQDPFDLQHNLTKDVSKVYLSLFRMYCRKSLDVLC